MSEHPSGIGQLQQRSGELICDVRVSMWRRASPTGRTSWGGELHGLDSKPIPIVGGDYKLTFRGEHDIQVLEVRFDTRGVNRATFAGVGDVPTATFDGQ